MTQCHLKRTKAYRNEWKMRHRSVQTGTFHHKYGLVRDVQEVPLGSGLKGITQLLDGLCWDMEVMVPGALDWIEVCELGDQSHQCLYHPGSADMLQSHMCSHYLLGSKCIPYLVIGKL